MFERLGAFVSHRWLTVVIVWLLLALGLHVLAPRWEQIVHDGDLAYLPANLPSVQGQRLLAEAFPEERAKSQIAIVVERPDGPLTAADLRWSDTLTDRFEHRAEDLAISEVWNRNTQVVGERLTSRVTKTGQATVTLLGTRNEFMAVGNMRLMAEVQKILDHATPSAPRGLNVGITGSAAVGGDMLRSAAESLQNTELTTVVLVVIILLLVYRAPLLVLVPVVTIGVALFVSTDLLALLTLVSDLPGFSWWHFKVFTTTKIFIVVILFGAGTDFCLFLISRYKEELEAGRDKLPASREAVARVGGALLASAMTTVCGLSMMYFAEFGKFRNGGPAIALCLLVALAACLTLAPALLSAAGMAVFWPFGARHAPGEPSDRLSRFWHWAARVIVRRPGLILLASVLLLLPLGLQGLSLRITYDFLNELEKTCASVRGTEIARRHFGAGEMSPVTVLALLPDGHFETPEGMKKIAILTKKLYDAKGVERVFSIEEPLGDRPGYFQPFRTSGLKKMAARAHRITKAEFISQVPKFAGRVARFDVELTDDPFSPGAIDQYEHVERLLGRVAADEKSPWHNAQFAFVGTTAGIRDLRQVTRGDERLIQVLVVICVLGVLLVLLRQPLVSAYLVLSVLFSYFVTIGATQWVFAWLYGGSYYGLDWKVPIFLFVILIAVGEDYNIYLITRVVEEQRRFGPLDGLRRAVARTGGIITSCGVIMAGTFVSMLSGKLRGMLELGFALSLGVMLDTCVVRPVLVPAFLALVDRLRRPRARRAKPQDEGLVEALSHR